MGHSTPLESLRPKPLPIEFSTSPPCTLLTDSVLIPPLFNNPFPPFHYLIIPDILRNTHSDFGLSQTSSTPCPCTCPSLSHRHHFSSFSRLTPSALHSVVLGHQCLIRLLGSPLSHPLGDLHFLFRLIFLLQPFARFPLYACSFTY